MLFSQPFFGGTSGDFSLEFWFRPDSNQNQTIYSHSGNPIYFPDYPMTTVSIATTTDGRVNFSFITGGPDSPFTLSYSTGTNMIVPEQWQHLAIVYGSIKSLPPNLNDTYLWVNFFLNGQLVSANTNNNSFGWLHVSWDLDPAYPVNCLGAQTTGPGIGDWFAGAIGEFRTWNRGLSQAEIQAKMFQVLNPTNETGLVGYWRFTEGNSNIVYDLAGTNNGTIHGATWSADLPTQPLQAPSITQQPMGQTVMLGAANVAFSVGVSGSPPYVYQWMLNGTNVPITNTSGGTSNTLTIKRAGSNDLGAYSVVVSNVVGSVTSSNAVLTMHPFLFVPYTGTVAIWGKDAVLSVTVAGSGPFNYQWYENGMPISWGTNQTLILASIQFKNAGAYSVVVSSPFGSVTNAPAQVVVNPAGVSLAMYAGVMIDGVVGYTYSIQFLPSLANTNNWITMTNLTLQQTPQLWIDTSANAYNNPQRFYRVVPPQ